MERISGDEVFRGMLGTEEDHRVPPFRPTEVDPHGKSLHEPGSKGDAGKIRPSLVLGGFARALIEVCKVGTYGAVKYSDNGWMEVPNGEERYADAMYRHILYAEAGEEFDLESGLPHLAHACWNLLAVIELKARGKK